MGNRISEAAATKLGAPTHVGRYIAAITLNDESGTVKPILNGNSEFNSADSVCSVADNTCAGALFTLAGCMTNPEQYDLACSTYGDGDQNNPADQSLCGKVWENRNYSADASEFTVQDPVKCKFETSTLSSQADVSVAGVDWGMVLQDVVNPTNPADQVEEKIKIKS